MCIVCKRIVGGIPDQQWEDTDYIVCCPRISILPPLPRDLFYLDCTHGKLTELPPSLPNGLEHLYVSFCEKLTMLPPLPAGLLTLHCIGCNFTEIHCNRELEDLTCPDCPKLTRITCPAQCAVSIHCHNCPMLINIPPATQEIFCQKCPWLHWCNDFILNEFRLKKIQRCYRKYKFRCTFTTRICLKKKLYPCLVDKILGYTGLV